MWRPPRIADYRDLMREASIISVSRGTSVGAVSVLCRAVCRSTDSARASCGASASRYAEIVDGDLDKAAVGRKKVLLQRPIADGWWLQRDGS